MLVPPLKGRGTTLGGGGVYMIINLENDQEKIELADAVLERLQQGLQAVARLNELEEEAEVDVTIVDDEEIHALNRADNHAFFEDT